MTLQAPETLGHNLSAKTRGQVRTGARGDLSAQSAALKSGQGGTPRTAAPWLAEKIAQTRRQAKPTTCRKCGAPTLTGDDHDRVTATAIVDPEPVSQLVEVVALLTGRNTYNLVRGNLYYRDHHHVGRTSTEPVHLEHKCPT